MKTLTRLILILISIACTKNTQNSSIFLPNCHCSKFDFESGPEVRDSLNSYTIRTPDSTWNPSLQVDNSHSMIIQGKKLEAGISVVTTSLTNFEPPWNESKEVMDFKRRNNVILEGKLDTLHWYVVDEKQASSTTLFVSYIDSIRNLHFTTTLMTTDTLNPMIRLCELEGILKTIKLR